MHLQGDFISETELDRYSSIYQTSSPSYVMMAGIDSCIDFLKQNGREYFENYQKNLKDFYDRAAQLKNIKVYINNADNADIFYKIIQKFLFSVAGLLIKELKKNAMDNGCMKSLWTNIICRWKCLPLIMCWH